MNAHAVICDIKHFGKKAMFLLTCVCSDFLKLAQSSCGIFWEKSLILYSKLSKQPEAKGKFCKIVVLLNTNICKMLCYIIFSLLLIYF